MNSHGGTLSIVGERLKASVSIQWGNAQHTTLVTKPGVKYRVSFIIDLNGEGRITPFARDVATSTNLTVIQADNSGRYYYEFVATGTTTMVAFESPHAYARDFYLDNLFITYQENTNAPYETNNQVQGYLADVINSYDYSPFGVQLDGRTLESDNHCINSIIVDTNYAINDDFQNGLSGWSSYSYCPLSLDSNLVNGENRLAIPACIEPAGPTMDRFNRASISYMEIPVMLTTSIRSNVTIMFRRVLTSSF